MRFSRYNFVFPLENGTFLAYNALSNGLAEVDEACAHALRERSLAEFASLDEHVQRELERGGFVVADALDERDVVRVRFRAAQYATRSLGLTVCPTLACNLACRYCFEGPVGGSMTRETEDAVARFAEQRLPERGGSLSVAWYGGEPLLALDVVERLSGKFLRVCEEKEASYHATIITNGTLLDRRVARRLAACQVSSAQVTLDGPPPVHDRRRPFRNGRGTFSRIVANLQEAAPLLRIALRINVDRHNAREALKFVDWLLAQEWFDRERFDLHFGYVRKFTPSCGCGLDEMLKPEEFHALSDQLAAALTERGFTPPYPDLATGCTATSASSFVVGPQGELYRCWNHVGDRTLAVGSVFEEIRPHPLLLRYLLAGFEDDPECLECRFLPLCGGGCVDLREKVSAGFLPAKDCSRWRYSLERRLEAYYRWWWRQQRQETRREA